jgi:hypothetical protein
MEAGGILNTTLVINFKKIIAWRLLGFHFASALKPRKQGTFTSNMIKMVMSDNGGNEGISLILDELENAINIPTLRGKGKASGQYK